MTNVNVTPLWSKSRHKKPSPKSWAISPKRKLLLWNKTHQPPAPQPTKSSAIPTPKQTRARKGGKEPTMITIVHPGHIDHHGREHLYIHVTERNDDAPWTHKQSRPLPPIPPKGIPA